jgi:hypothetical protein
MKRLTAAVITLAFLALTASAFAQIWNVSSRVGSRYTAPSTTGSCKVSSQPLLGTATIYCRSDSSATVHYPFTLKQGCGPTVSPTVDWLGTQPGVSAKTTDRKVDVAVHVSGRARTVISLASISFYC